MSNVNYEDIKTFLNDHTYLKRGKEVDAYHLGDEVVKIFYDNPKPVYKRLNDKQLRLLASLPLKAFNNITGFVETGEKGVEFIAGYKEKYLEDEEFKLEELCFYDRLFNLVCSLDDIKDDVAILSENGFIITDLTYNYFYKDGKITLNDMTSYQQFTTNNQYLKDKIIRDNLKTINTFLIGLIIYNGYKKGNSNEYTLTYKALQYNDKYCKNQYFGDLFKKMYSIDDNYRDTKKV